MKKVWVENGCIVCRACEMLAGEVFVVTEETALVRPDADLTSDENVREAADVCPVEVIRYRE